MFEKIAKFFKNKFRSTDREVQIMEEETYNGMVDLLIVKDILKNRSGATVDDEVLYDFLKFCNEKYDAIWSSVNPIEDEDKVVDLFVEFMSLDNKKEIEIRYKQGGGFTPEQCRQKISDVMKKFGSKYKPDDTKAITAEDDFELGAVPIYAATFLPAAAYAAPAYMAAFNEKYYTVSIIGYDKSKRLDMIRKMRDLDPLKGLSEAKNRLDNLPYVVESMASKYTVNYTKSNLESLGFEVEVKEVN